MTEQKPDVPAWAKAYFGPEWPSGVCEEGKQVDTPVGYPCVLCSEKIEDGDQGSFMGTQRLPYYGPVHRECSLRSVLGGIGHLEHHNYWCTKMKDPDGGKSYRDSALEVWVWVHQQGWPKAE